MKPTHATAGGLSPAINTNGQRGTGIHFVNMRTELFIEFSSHVDHQRQPYSSQAAKEKHAHAKE